MKIFKREEKLTKKELLIKIGLPVLILIALIIGVIGVLNIKQIYRQQVRQFGLQ